MVEIPDGDLFEGLERFRKYYRDEKIAYKDLSDSDFDGLLALNRKLSKLEKEIITEYNKLYSFAQQRVDIEDDRLCCFYIEIFIEFYLDKNHPAYKEDGDNLLTVLYTSHEMPSFDFGIGDGIEHTTLLEKNLALLKSEKHCYIMHSLYEHTSLNLQELLVIGSFEYQFRLILDYD